MKLKTTLFFIAFLINCSTTIRAQSEKWHYYNMAGDGQCAITSYKDMVFDGAGNTYAVGINLVPYGGYCFRQPNIIVHKFDDTGSITATYQYDYNGLEEDDLAISIKRENSTGKIYVLGYSHQFMILLKLTGNLGLQYEKRFYDLNPVSFAVAFNSVFVAGNTGDGAVVLRYKTSNMKLTGYSLYEDGVASDLDLTSSGLVITGSVPTNSNGQALFVQRLDSMLLPVWSKVYNRYSGNYQDQGLKVRVLSDNVYVGGNTQNASVSNIGMVIKYNSAGTQQWVKLLANSPAANDYAAFRDLCGDAYNQDIYALGYKSPANRLYRYNTGGTKLLDSTVTPLATGPGYFATELKCISNNGSSLEQASLLFFSGQNYYVSGFSNFERCISYWTTISGAYAWSDYDQPGGLDPSFGFTYGKVNKQVTPNLYCAVGGGRTESGSPQSSGSTGVIDCYNIASPMPRPSGTTSDNSILLQPNPAGEQLTVNTTGFMQSYKILDPGGIVMTSGNASGFRAVIPVSDLVPGMYMLQVQTVNGQLRQKFIRVNKK